MPMKLAKVRKKTAKNSAGPNFSANWATSGARKVIMTTALTDARNVMEAAIGHQAWRLRNAEEPTVDDLRTLTAADVLGDAATEVVEWQAADQDVPESEEATPEEASDEALPDADQPPTEGEATP